MRPRFYAVLVGLFAAIAGIIAAVGIYAVLAFAVVQRTHEIGVRMALGARRGAVVATVMRQGVVLASLGVVLGLAGAVAVTRSLSTMLFGLSPLDRRHLCRRGDRARQCGSARQRVPARRATRVDPVVALRCE